MKNVDNDLRLEFEKCSLENELEVLKHNLDETITQTIRRVIEIAKELDEIEKHLIENQVKAELSQKES